MSVLDKLAGATTRTHTVTLILDAALEAEWEDLQRQLNGAIDADEKGNVREGESLALPATTKVIDQMEAKRDQIAASQVHFEFAPMDWPERLALQSDHSPRENNTSDRLRGYNTVTFIKALIKATCVKVIDETGDESTEIPDATWDHLLGNPEADPPIKPTLVHAQIAKLFAGAQGTDLGTSRVPPSARSLLETQDTGASLAQPSPGQARPRSGSEGGSRPTSRRSSTTKKAPSKGSPRGT